MGTPKMMSARPVCSSASRVAASRMPRTTMRLGVCGPFQCLSYASSTSCCCFCHSTMRYGPVPTGFLPNSAVPPASYAFFCTM